MLKQNRASRVPTYIVELTILINGGIIIIPNSR